MLFLLSTLDDSILLMATLCMNWCTIVSTYDNSVCKSFFIWKKTLINLMKILGKITDSWKRKNEMKGWSPMEAGVQ